MKRIYENPSFLEQKIHIELTGREFLIMLAHFGANHDYDGAQKILLDRFGVTSEQVNMIGNNSLYTQVCDIAYELTGTTPD